nr:hypothetical protein [Tanacetum cinerariifolium]
MKKMMMEEFCPNEEVQRMEDELRSLKLRDMNIAAYTQRPGHFAKDCRRRSTPVCYECGGKGETQNYCPKKKNPQGEEARGRTYVIKEVDKDQGPNVVM